MCPGTHFRVPKIRSSTLGILSHTPSAVPKNLIEKLNLTQPTEIQIKPAF
jgi:hypothetical protein